MRGFSRLTTEQLASRSVVILRPPILYKLTPLSKMFIEFEATVKDGSLFYEMWAERSFIFTDFYDSLLSENRL
jgi:hypothetical protein